MIKFQQISLFDTLSGVSLTATSCSTGAAEKLRDAEQWMKQLVTGGEYVIDIGKHLMVLKPTSTKRERIPSGHEYYHYEVDGKVYYGVFVG